jgi:excinuclease UvrABC nuclease subunit
VGKWFPSSIKRSSYFSIPEAPGCYALFFAGELVYVGMSHCLRQRLKSHNMVNTPGPNMYDGWMATPWGNLPWAEGKLTGKLRLADSPADALRVEQKLIRRLNPRFNKRGRTDRGR